MLKKFKTLKSYWLNHGFMAGSKLAFLKLMGMYAPWVIPLGQKMSLALKLPFQDRYLYKVSGKNWQTSLDFQFDKFSLRPRMPMYKALKAKEEGASIDELRELLFVEAKSFHTTYKKLGYPFVEMFREFSPPKPRVMQLAVGSCPEMTYLVKELDFEYYIEDPLFSQIFKVVDLREIFKNEVAGFCSLPAEEMWKDYPEFFDVIVSHNVLNHTYDPGRVIDSVAKMVKKGGLVFDFTIRQPSVGSHPGMIGQKALLRGYTSRGFEIVYSAAFKHLDFPSFPQKHRFYSLFRRRK